MGTVILPMPLLAAIVTGPRVSATSTSFPLSPSSLISPSSTFCDVLVHCNCSKMQFFFRFVLFNLLLFFGHGLSMSGISANIREARLFYPAHIGSFERLCHM
ncbi:hypothetical protein ILYODFUR_028800 [Ilyodon furcidens]|uniref:Secreted protein n=1 Tax=Ilyodon furcidens TaxID=33524 RepID=A0ABV0UNQ7_9TELE